MANKKTTIKSNKKKGTVTVKKGKAKVTMSIKAFFGIVAFLVIAAVGLVALYYFYAPFHSFVDENVFGKKETQSAFDYKEPEMDINGEVFIYSIEMHDQYGDSVFIKYGDYDILIDTGEKGDGKFVQQFVDSHISSDNNLDLFVGTHCHSDHLGGMTLAPAGSRALDNVATISNIIDFGHERTNYSMYTTYKSIRESYIAKGANYYPAYNAVNHINGMSNIIMFGELKVEIIDTNNYMNPSIDYKSADDYNDYSVALLITYKNTKLFCAGDLEDVGEQKLVANAQNTSLKDIKDTDTVIYKSCHHGTDVGSANDNPTSNNGGNRKALLDIIKPDVCFVSSTIGKSAHPFARAVATMLLYTPRVYFNGTNGTLLLSLDGDNVSVAGSGATSNYTINGEAVDYDSQKNLVYTQTEYFKRSTNVGTINWYKGGISTPTIKDVTEWYYNRLTA